MIVKNGLVEVETVQGESHGAHAEGSKLSAKSSLFSKEDVQATAVVEARIMEDQETEASLVSHDVERPFLFS